MSTGASSFADPRRRWPAPAKLNLFLHVIGRRPDGLHDIQTLFQFLDLCDELCFDLSGGDGCIVRVQGPPDIPPSRDLCVCAATLLRRHTGSTAGVRITLHKNIPQGAGLGGGSSCAATTLLALNHLWRLALPRDELARLGLQLGADVPVFVHGQAAFGESAGEQLRPYRPPERCYVVLVPEPPVPTARIYADPALHRASAPLRLDVPDEDALCRARNDLQPVTCRLFPQVAAALQWLDGRAAGARMSGSGGAVFAPVAAPEHGRRILEEAAWNGFVAHGINRHPLYAPGH